MGSQLTLSIIEIVVLMIGAITLGFTIHFFVISRKTFNDSAQEASGKTQKELDNWRLKYYNELEYREKELAGLKKQLKDTEENNEINVIEAEEMRKLNKQLKAELEAARKAPPVAAVTTAAAKPDYIEQLRKAQSSLMEHNDKINQLLGQIDIVKETEEKQQEILRTNEQLAEQIDELQLLLSQKEKEISTVRQKEQLSTEMTSMLDSAYNEFNVLQEKIQKLESQVSSSKRINLEYEDMKEGYYRMTQDFEDQRKKYNAALSDNKKLLEELTEVEDKFKEANFQRQQLQKRVAYLEELNNDMQAVADANKKLEHQLKRIGELESMLNVVAEERDHLAQRHTRTS